MINLDFFINKDKIILCLEDRGVYTVVPSLLLFLHAGFFQKCKLGHMEKRLHVPCCWEPAE